MRGKASDPESLVHAVQTNQDCQSRPRVLPHPRTIGMATFTAILSLLAALLASRMSPSRLLLPLGGNDGVALYQFSQTTRWFGWFTWNPDIGYPFGMDHAHFPAPELRMWALLRLLVQVTDDAILALNAFYLIGFSTVGASAYLLLHATVRTDWIAVPLAVSTATVPWHFDRFQHALLADYSAVPLGLLLCYLMWSGWWDHSRGRLALALAVGVFIGSGGVYFSFYALLALTPVALWRWWTHRGSPELRRTLTADAAVLAIIPLTLGVCLLAHSSLARTPAAELPAFARNPEESLVNAGNILTLFTPWPISGGPGGEEGDALYNVLGAISVVVSLAAGVWVIAVRLAKDPNARLPERAGETLPWLGMLLWMLLWFLPGMGLLFAHLVSPNLRSWGRVSLEILFVSTVISAILLAGWAKSRGQVPAAGALLSLIVALQLVPDHRAFLAPWGAQLDEAAVSYRSAVLATLPPRCPVLQVPLLTYPEGFPLPTPHMGVYDHMWTQVYIPELRWSFGVVGGTVAGQAVAARYPRGGEPSTVVDRAREDGYCAVQIDERGMWPGELEAYDEVLGEADIRVDRWRLHLLEHPDVLGHGEQRD